MTLRARSISIRWSLFKNFLILVVLISGGLLVFSRLQSGKTIRGLSATLLEETSAAAERELASFFSPIARAIEILRGQAILGIFSPGNPATANAVAMPVLSTITQMSSINTGDAEGNSYILLKRKDEWLNVQVRNSVGEWRRFDTSGNLLQTWQRPFDFDPRTRPWYQLVRENGDDAIHWTAPYAFVPTGDPGITAAVSVRSRRGSYVLAFDVLLEDLASFGRRIVLPEKGVAFVLTDDARFLIPPAGTDEELKRLLLQRPEDLGLALVKESILLWRERQAVEPFRFSYDGEAWWGRFKKYDLSPERRFWIAVLVPERELLGETRREFLPLLSATALALGVATLMALYLSRSYSAPLRELIAHSARLQSLDTEVPVHVESRLAEVRMLAEAHEKMRRALDSFARYVPVGVVRELLARGEAATIGGRETQVTVLFTDIEGFTSIAESTTPAELTRSMSSYFDGLVEILTRRGATVDKFIGDAIMAFWGAPKIVENPSRQAVEAVLEIREWLEAANREWRAEGRPELPTRFGLASGKATVGNVGATRRISYTALGDPVNLAHRLEALNAEFSTSVLADENVRHAAGNDFAWRHVGEIPVRGKAAPVHVFELLGRQTS